MWEWWMSFMNRKKTDHVGFEQIEKALTVYIGCVYLAAKNSLKTEQSTNIGRM